MVGQNHLTNLLVTRFNTVDGNANRVNQIVGQEIKLRLRIAGTGSTAGVPGVGLIMLAMVLNQVGLPVEGIALIMGVDRLLDMVRTAVNVTGDSVATLIIAKSENAFSQETYDDPQAGKTAGSFVDQVNAELKE